MQRDNIDIIVIENFYSHSLDNHRNIRIYLPPSYEKDFTKHYPVLYVHDGQNVFDGQYSYSGKSWDLHHTVEYLIDKNLIEEIIIVAADNMEEERLSEYAHQDGYFQGEDVEASGYQYEEFLVEELMPVINHEFRTKKGRENTALMGSSMGGLVTFNIGMRRPELFSKLAVMSPSLWWGDEKPIDKLKKYDYSGISSKMWIDTGDAEGKFMSFSDEVLAELKEVKEDNSLEIVYYLAPDAVHSESAWAKRVHSPLLYFFGSIGRAEELELFSSPIVGIEGPGQLINPVITTDNNFKMTVLNGNYKSSKSDILEVSELGRLIPKKSGKAEITFSALGLKAEKEVEVVKKLSKEVEVEINLHLNDQNNFNDLFMAASKPREIKMEKIGDRDYTASITLKRGELIHFKFTLGSWEAVEKDAEGRDIDSRTIRADKKKSLYFEAERFY